MLSKTLLILPLLCLESLAIPTGSPTESVSTTTTATTSTTADATSTSQPSYLRVASYPAWRAADPDRYGLSQVPWIKYDIMNFALAPVYANESAIVLDDPTKALLQDFVSHAHNNTVKAMLSIGGVDGYQNLSMAMSTPERRATFLQSIVDIAFNYSLNGIDFDWELPNKTLLQCSLVPKNNTDNYLSLLHDLKKVVGPNFMLTAAVPVTPFVGADDKPLSNVTEFTKVLNHIVIKAYDIWDGQNSKTVGPNAPLDDACTPNAAGSVKSAVKAWTDAGFPEEQIILGVPSYGHAYTVNATEAVKTGNYPTFDRIENLPELDMITYPDPRKNGTIDFREMIDFQLLNENGTVELGLTRFYYFDTCSQTPFLYEIHNKTMISYDDVRSYAEKGRFIHARKLKGFAISAVTGDTKGGLLVNSITEGMKKGIEAPY